MAGHSLSFFVDGTETSAVALSFIMYELALNPQCQAILHEEIVKTITKYDGQITYDALQEINYLEGVIYEGTRIHPPVLFMLKLCNKHYTLPKTSKQSKPTIIQPETSINNYTHICNTYVSVIYREFLSQHDLWMNRLYKE